LRRPHDLGGLNGAQAASNFFVFMLYYSPLCRMEGHQPGASRRRDGAVGRPDVADTIRLSYTLGQVMGPHLWGDVHAGFTAWSDAKGRGWLACGKLSKLRSVGIVAEGPQLTNVRLASGHHYDCTLGGDELVFAPLYSSDGADAEDKAAALFCLFDANELDVACVMLWAYVDSVLNGVDMSGLIWRWSRRHLFSLPRRWEQMFGSNGRVELVEVVTL
jgi:hypothetical protein